MEESEDASQKLKIFLTDLFITWILFQKRWEILKIISTLHPGESIKCLGNSIKMIFLNLCVLDLQGFWYKKGRE